MGAVSETLEQVAEQYPHRTVETIEGDVDTDEILENYFSHECVEDYSLIESDFPYQAALGRVSDSEGQIVLTSRFTYPSEDGVKKDEVQACIEIDGVAGVLEDKIISPENVLDGAGAELDEERTINTFSGDVFRPETVHCIAFYERPVVSAVEDTGYESAVHEQAAMKSLSEPSLGTAMITTGRKSNGEAFTGAQVDYWTRTIDGLNGGLDYGKLDWENPGGL